jgi:hypothetical protein
MAGSRGRVGGSTVFGSVGSGLGARRCRRVVSNGGIHVRDSGAAQGSY